MNKTTEETKTKQDWFKKTEGMLYSYFENINRVRCLLEEKLLIKQSLSSDAKSVPICERVKSSITAVSKIEEGMIIQQEKIEKINKQINRISFDIKRVERAISLFDDEEEKIFRYKYKNKNSVKYICTMINIGRTTFYEKRTKMIEKAMLAIYPEIEIK